MEIRTIGKSLPGVIARLRIETCPDPSEAGTPRRSLEFFVISLDARIPPGVYLAHHEGPPWTRVKERLIACNI
jgi:hypothetical protein